MKNRYKRRIRSMASARKQGILQDFATTFRKRICNLLQSPELFCVIPAKISQSIRSYWQFFDFSETQFKAFLKDMVAIDCKWSSSMTLLSIWNAARYCEKPPYCIKNQPTKLSQKRRIALLIEPIIIGPGCPQHLWETNGLKVLLEPLRLCRIELKTPMNATPWDIGLITDECYFFQLDKFLYSNNVAG